MYTTYVSWWLREKALFCLFTPTRRYVPFVCGGLQLWNVVLWREATSSVNRQTTLSGSGMREEYVYRLRMAGVQPSQWLFSIICCVRCSHFVKGKKSGKLAASQDMQSSFGLLHYVSQVHVPLPIAGQPEGLY